MAWLPTKTTIASVSVATENSKSIQRRHVTRQRPKVGHQASASREHTGRCHRAPRRGLSAFGRRDHRWARKLTPAGAADEGRLQVLLTYRCNQAATFLTVGRRMTNGGLALRLSGSSASTPSCSSSPVTSAQHSLSALASTGTHWMIKPFCLRWPRSGQPSLELESNAVSLLISCNRRFYG